MLHTGEVADPAIRAHDVLIRVAAAGVNRADILQRRGFYPPPPGASPILGLEVAGVVAAAGAAVSQLRAGDRVMALLEGGGYAELAAAPEAQTVRVPDSIDLISAAGIAEASITAHDNLFTRAGLQAGETVLLHGGAGGVGTAAIQLASAADCQVIVTAGSSAKLQRCAQLGAHHGIDYREEDFVARVRDLTSGAGANVILDIMGAAYLERTLEALADDGRLVVIGMQGGTSAELNLGMMLRRRALLICTMLRSRPAVQKAAIVAAFVTEVLPRLTDGTLRAVIDRVVPLHDAAAAHRALENGDVFGKVVLEVAAL